MEIEKLIDALKKARADGSWNTLSDLSHKAATALEQFQAENDRLKRERDTAAEDLNAIIGDIEEIRRCNNFKWRGPKEKSPEYRISNVGRPSACTTQDVSTVEFHKEGAGDTFVLYPVKEGES